MMMNKAMDTLTDHDFLDKLYGYSYRRCNTSHEAEDLCSEIVLNIYKAILKSNEIENFYGFAWTVAYSH